MGNHAWKIYATGEINSDAGKRLAAIIANKHIPGGSKLFLNSPGGSLGGGMSLGRAIRKNHLGTYIGQLDPNSKVYGSQPGYCYSACAIAFLGGAFRYWTNGSVFGVHRFFWKKHSNNDADLAQIVSAAVVEYIQSMGVSPRLFALASKAGANQAITPSHRMLLALRVVNDGRDPVKWTIESIPEGMYLKGEQQTDNGITKFMLTCPASGKMNIIAIFDAGQNTKQVMTWSTNWLFISGRQFRIDNRLTEKLVINGWINLTYGVDPALLNALTEAKSVGVGLSPAPGAAFFEGFGNMPFGGGREKLPGFLEVCHSRGR